MVNAASHGQNLPLVDQSERQYRPVTGPAGVRIGRPLQTLDQSRSAQLLDLSPIVRAGDARRAQLPANAATSRRYKFERKNDAHCPWVQCERANDPCIDPAD